MLIKALKHKITWFVIVILACITTMIVLSNAQGYQHSPHQLISLKKIKKLNKNPIFTAKIVKSFYQKQPTFVQGIVYDKDKLYTSSGGYGKSFIRQSSLATGEIIHQRYLNKSLFAEGITIFHHKLYQIFWHQQHGAIYNTSTLEKIGQFAYQGQGWGLTHNSRYLIMSNGSSQLVFLDPEHKFSVAKRLNITASWGPIDNLNSLFYHDHIIYANIWFTDLIAMISPQTGHVLGWIDISGLYPKQNTLSRDCATANGITYDNKTQHLIITGKCWSKLYEIKYHFFIGT